MAVGVHTGGGRVSRVYAGVGSRRTPPDVLELMTALARRFAAKGWTLRSGRADGADLAFEAGAGEAKEIYLPWPGFNGSDSPLDHVGSAALALGERHHPRWGSLNRAARLLIARDGYQVLGADLASPARFLVCWTPDGCVSAAERTAATGGTGQAIAIASVNDVPVFNLARADHRARLSGDGAADPA